MMPDMRLYRQEARYQLRSFLRRITKIKRVRYCGLPLKDSIIVHRQGDKHYFSGLATCGSSFVCPVCAAKIRYRRADEASKVIVSALDKGMSSLFVTRTIPHSAEDALGVTLNLLAEGRRYVSNQPVVKELRRAMGHLGTIASKEISYGVHGWHPHTHDIEFYEREVSLEHFANISQVYYDYLNRYYCQNGFQGLSRQHGVRVEQVTISSAALAAYVTKIQEGASIQLQTAQELTRSDLKHGRAGSLMPFDILREFFNTGSREARDLWHEFERGVAGKSSIRFTKGLRRRFIEGPELTDRQEAAREIGGVRAVYFTNWFYRKIVHVPGLEGKVLTALDSGGFGALVELLVAYQLDELDGYWSIADTVQN